MASLGLDGNSEKPIGKGKVGFFGPLFTFALLHPNRSQEFRVGANERKCIFLRHFA